MTNPSPEGKLTTGKQCKTCGGTGWIWSHRSWFTADGFYRSRCGICAGSGQSAFRPAPDYARFQRNARALHSNTDDKP